MGTRKNWDTYEKRIALLQEKNQTLAVQLEEEQEQRQLAESMNLVEPYEYLLLAEDGYVAVYHADGKTLYAATDIQLIGLPEELQKEIREGKGITNEEQLYSFLENYSS